ncbi:MAG: DUF4179 domain-containing protein [Terrisporobacter sp.]
MKDIKIKDNIKVSDKLDEYILKGLDEGIEIKKEENSNKKNNKKPYLKIATMVAVLSVGTLTGVYAVDKIVDYFKYNKNSIYKYEESDIEKHAQVINKSKTYQGVKFTLDTVSSDDSYIVVNYTVKSDKKLSEFKGYENISMANPFVRLLRGDKEVFDGGNMETEATFISDYELKGMMRFRVGRYDIKDKTKLTIDTWDVLGIEEDWSIDFDLEKKLTKVNTYKYEVNKSQIIDRQLEYKGEKLQIKNKITVDNIVIGPMGNTITLTEEVDSPRVDYITDISNNFALFDENNNYLKLIDKGGLSIDKPNKPLTSTYEFISNNNVKSITLVPMIYNENVENKLLDLQSIENLAFTFEVSKYSKVTIDNFEINEDKIKYSYKTEGVFPDNLDLVLCDENGKIIVFDSGFVKEAVDRDNNKVDVIMEFDSEKDKEAVKKIKNITLYSNNGLQLMYDKQLKINLQK